MKKNILIICPHTSTGGSGQFTANKISLIKDDFNIKVVEYSFIAWNYIVQRNRIINLVGEDNFYSLGGDKSQLNKIILEFQPDIILMEEFPEMFMHDEIADWIYKKPIPYTIIETTHDSSFNPSGKRYLPDKYTFVSPYNAMKFVDTKIPIEIVEYPTDYIQSISKEDARKLLGFEPNYHHILIVGLFTQRKNQGYAFELATKLIDYKVKFHFVGNMASNFESYWKPLMENKPENCIIWDERDDVDTFLSASDLFLFPSKGDRNNKELMPIAIKEALNHNLSVLMYNLDVYMNKYDDYNNVHYLRGNVDDDVSNIHSILKLEMNNLDNQLIVIGTYPNLKKREELTKECIESFKPLGKKILLISHYPVDKDIQEMCDYYIYDKDNPLTHHSYYDRFYNDTTDYHALIYINALKNSNQSLTVLTNLFTACKFAKANNFDSFFYSTFDVIIHEDDLNTIDYSLNVLSNNINAYLCKLSTPFGKGIQTNGMSFKTDYFLETFDDVRTPEEYNKRCMEKGCQNFLEDYMMKCILANKDKRVSFYDSDEKGTLLVNSGLGESSNSEYYSIIPIEGEENKFMFYFYSYNLDGRKFELQIQQDGKLDVTLFNILNREFKKEITFNGTPIIIDLSFYDGDTLYKKEHYKINSEKLDFYKTTGNFRWKNLKPKVKLVHLQTTLNHEKEQKSREQLEKVKEYGWEYILHTNIPYADLPPKFNCSRPDCVSLHLRDEGIPQHLTSLTPAHYGCYESFKNAILCEFYDCDLLLLCEGDCKVEIPIDEFVKKVESTYSSIKSHKIGYISYGDKNTLEHGWFQSPKTENIPNQSLIYATDHIIGLQCIGFPSFVRNWLQNELRTRKWDCADTYFNQVFNGSPYRMAIVENRLTSQFDGYSLLDKTEKKFL